MVFGTCGPSGLKGLAARIRKPGLAGQDSRRVDFAALKAELDALESIGIDITAGGNGETAKKATAKQQDAVAGRFKSDKEREAEETEERADACFWDGLYHEKLDDPIKLFYCPVIESRADCGLGARLAYTEASRLFGRCIDLDQTHLTYYAKRCAALCKLRMFPRAFADAQTYASTRPDSPTGHCLKGTVYDGLNQYNQAIACLEKSLVIADIIPYDGSRVWSTGTLVADNLRQAVERRAKVAERARVANQHGVKWRSLGEYGRAVPNLVEAAQLQKDCVGDMHLHYGTCLNNLGACMEAMGAYQDAMLQYKHSQKISESASPGTLRIMACSARHLPHVMKAGKLLNGQWVESEDQFSCDSYVQVEMVEAASGESRTSQAVCTRVNKANYQPTWNQVLGLKAARGDECVVVRLIGRNPQRVALEEAASNTRRLIKGHILTPCHPYLAPSHRYPLALLLTGTLTPSHRHPYSLTAVASDCWVRLIAALPSPHPTVAFIPLIPLIPLIETMRDSMRGGVFWRLK